MREFSLLGFAEHLAAITGEMVHAEHEALEHAAIVVEREAKAAVGAYQEESGPFVAWAELADSTKADRAAKGYAEDEPELRTGEMRDSIEHRVTMEVLGESYADIGSDSQILEWQELGTEKMPPRSILGGAAARKEKEVVGILASGVISALIGEEVVGRMLPIT